MSDLTPTIEKLANLDLYSLKTDAIEKIEKGLQFDQGIQFFEQIGGFESFKNDDWHDEMVSDANLGSFGFKFRE
ncbi:hypothetical protein M153_5940003584 [Pseudoloma neurophilia]|uniref:Uncharacterized protein n=1 Tax=Pseudoloma neurophilia TaxID=146866 RepID=A0A0R0M3Y6_9MICR|nr:hypothetical protein M153_5940003584 [Pseudoloma neurophilia]